jgi:sulfonate transport system ATP-binding protein
MTGAALMLQRRGGEGLFFGDEQRDHEASPPDSSARSEPERPSRGGAGLSLKFKGVVKSFGDRTVLQGVDLDIPQGQFVAIVGRSGGGKTTLMRLIAGLDAPTSGAVLIDGVSVRGLQESVRLLFQDARLLPWQTALGNVGIARQPGWRETAREALAHVGLQGREHDWPAVLSGGQRQRVALARALVSNPGVLLLDEPYGALDALTRGEMHQLTERIWRERGFTTLLITHDVAEAVALGDRVIVLRDGRIALDVAVDLPRPRRLQADPAAAALQTSILKQV